MNLEDLPFYVILFGIVFSAELVTFRHKKYSERELLEISNQYSGVRWKYWGWAIVTILPIIITVNSGFSFAARYPSIQRELRFFFGALAVSYISFYKAVFALLTNVYPVDKNDGFVIGENDKIRALALHGIVFVVVLLGLTFVYGIAF